MSFKLYLLPRKVSDNHLYIIRSTSSKKLRAYIFTFILPMKRSALHILHK